MIDPFETARAAWLGALGVGASSSVEDEATAIAAVAFLKRVRMELPTLWVLEPPSPGAGPPTLIVAPFALHDARLADFAPGHSLAARLAEAGIGRLALTFWRSATADMANFGIDAYLSDLNVVVDDFGGRAALVGLCQGGWLAALYAARFPGKVAALALAGAPIDLAAAPSALTRLVATVPPAAFQAMVALGGGRVFGRLVAPQWTSGLRSEFLAEEALQRAPDGGLAERFEAWNARTVDLPGAYFLQTAEWLFRDNRLAQGRFPALGRLCRLADVVAPVFALAGAEDEVAPAPQALAVAALCGGASATTRVVPGKHLALFMGRRVLDGAWGEIAAWLKDAAGARARPRRARA